MEGVSASMFKGLRGYWNRRGYKKLQNGSGSYRRRGDDDAGTGSTRKSRRRVWRIRRVAAPKLGWLIRRAVASPKRLLVWLRDAYVRMMLGLANSRVCSTGYGGALCGDGIGSFGRGPPLKEYDEKMIVEIYKSILMQAQGHLVHRDAPKLCLPPPPTT